MQLSDKVLKRPCCNWKRRKWRMEFLVNFAICGGVERINNVKLVFQWIVASKPLQLTDVGRFHSLYSSLFANTTDIYWDCRHCRAYSLLDTVDLGYKNIGYSILMDITYTAMSPRKHIYYLFTSFIADFVI